ncbi:MAG: hypothetical protein ACP5KN_18000, partial [Armatimonadota bacterium]
MHEWDIAASNPCPFCVHLEACPKVGHPRDDCLEFWPLGRPRHRELTGDDADAKRWRAIALANPEVRKIVDHWGSGRQVSDDQYLHLRSLINSALTDESEHAHWYILLEMLYPRATRYLDDAVHYYRVGEPSKAHLRQVSAALRGGIIIANEYMVRNGTSITVPSHFERIVFDCLKPMIFGLAGMPFLKLPRGKCSFRRAVQDEWRRVLAYGNGFHGFTVHPRVHIQDLVRYQQLGSGDHLVSWSISNWLIWSMTAFPSPVAAVFPEFGDKAFGKRLEQMYEPLVQSYASKLVARAKLTEDGADVPKRSDVVGELRALLSHLIREYDFSYGKPDAMLSSVGAIGPASSPEWRQDLDERFAEFDLPFRARDVVHVGFTRYV